jgi:hypothetical protein
MFTINPTTPSSITYPRHTESRQFQGFPFGIYRLSLPRTETFQLYIINKVVSVVRPVKELNSFQRVYLPPGDKCAVVFNITTNDLRFYNSALQ